LNPDINRRYGTGGMSLNKERAVVSKRGVDDGNQKRWGLSPARLKEPLQL